MGIVLFPGIRRLQFLNVCSMQILGDLISGRQMIGQHHTGSIAWLTTNKLPLLQPPVAKRIFGHRSPCVYLISCTWPISQACPLHICILQAFKSCRWRRPWREAGMGTHKSEWWHHYCRFRHNKDDVIVHSWYTLRLMAYKVYHQWTWWVKHMVKKGVLTGHYCKVS